MTDWRSVPGWWSERCHQFYERCVEHAPPGAVFVELGVWQGRSTASLCTAIRDAGRDDIRVICVDTFRGSPPESDAGYHQRLIEEQGLKLRECFERHLQELGLRQYVTALVESDSAEAAKIYPDASVDLVMVDGDHRTDMVARDVSAWWPILRHGGIMCGHDGDAERVVAGARQGLGAEPVVRGQIWHHRKRLGVRPVGEPTALSTMALAYGMGETRHERSLLTHFGSDVVIECRKLAEYFEPGDLDVRECASPGRGDVFCPHDAPCEGATMKRSADTVAELYPAFPHGPWPFLSRHYEPEPVETNGKPRVGFCGVAHRPDIRREAVDALRTSLKLEPVILARREFLGAEVGRDQARDDYMRIMNTCPYQLVVRGAGNYCYRLYETLASGRIPVIVGERPLPDVDFAHIAVSRPELLESCVVEGVDGGIEEAMRFNRRQWWDYLTPHGWWREWARGQADA